MKEKQLHASLILNLRAYESLADDAGLPYLRQTDAQLATASVADLEKLVKQLRTLLRTPRE